MAKQMALFSAYTLLACAAVCFYVNPNAGSDAGHFDPQFYSRRAPEYNKSLGLTSQKPSLKKPAWGCDASILLDDTNSLIGEKRSRPNRDSACGFEVVDGIKSAVEKECNQTVSCADILALAARDSIVLVSEKQKFVALAARDSIVLAGGPSWEVPLGRRDTRSASLGCSNNNIPAPNNTFHTILNKFELQGLDIIDLVALSGSHTIGRARCVSFMQSLYNQSAGTSKLDKSYPAQLHAHCPRTFDNSYFKNLLNSKGLLSSDRALVSKNGVSMELAKIYAESNELFFQQFAKSMVKMGNISPLTGLSGEIRKKCRERNG
ncbi:UNVERIFIED_CONTAM: Peroxidase 72 [Sesamum radiatum]|uniref:Peroxidase n=1 Tax=Sesamum radiatum TaxID=300843 RepID=A0AAW2UPM2_SESRA